MQDREAIIIANSVSYGERKSGLPSGILKSFVRDLSGKLDGLGEDSFRSTIVFDNRRRDAERKILDVIRRSGRLGTSLLIYYVGHAVKNSEELFLFFKDSNWLEL